MFYRGSSERDKVLKKSGFGEVLFGEVLDKVISTCYIYRYVLKEKASLMKRKNCWEVKECGREQGGENVEALGTCPAALPNEYDYTNRGLYAGRFCWAVAGTFCGGQVQGTLAKKIKNCLRCDFLKQVQKEEGRHFILTPYSAEDKFN